MRIRLSVLILIINVLSLALVLFIYLVPVHLLRMFLGVSFLLFAPGFTLVAAFLAEKKGISGVQRLILSFALSIVITSFLGLLLNYSPWGISLESILYATLFFVFFNSVVAWLKQMRLPRQEQVFIDFRFRAPGRGHGAWDYVLSIVMIAVSVWALAMLAQFMTGPRLAESFTQFYVLGQEGKSSDYPGSLVPGEEGTVVLGITNKEGKEVSYRVQVIMDGQNIDELGPVVLNDEQEWRTEIKFVARWPSHKQKLEFWLYKENESKPYLEPLYLWIDVT